MEKNLNFINNEYKIIKNFNDAIDNEILQEKITDYFVGYNYIVGDWAYGKLRLKGFYKKGNKKCNLTNDSENIQKYLKEYCAYGCKYFILEKIEVEK